jgi:hypothetical protein
VTRRDAADLLYLYPPTPVVSLAPACLLTDAEPMTNSQVLYYKFDGTEKLSVRENGFESEWRVRIHACRLLAWCSTTSLASA